MATQFPIPAHGCIKLVMVVMCCITAWYVGQVLAQHILEGFRHKYLNTVQKVLQKPAFKGKKEILFNLEHCIFSTCSKRHECDHSSPCPVGTFAFTVLSGAEKTNSPKICFKDELLLGDVKNNFGRGMNIAIVEAKTGKHVNIGSFDLWGGDNSGQMIEFIKKAPDGSLILMATFDNRSTRSKCSHTKLKTEQSSFYCLRTTSYRHNLSQPWPSFQRLNEEAKKYIEELGSKLIWKLHFRGNSVFLGTKGFTLPENFQRKKIIKNEGTSNRYGSWPREIQIDGCFSPKTDYL